MTAHVATSPTAWKDVDPAGIKVAVGGVWKDVSDVFVASGGAWKQVVEPFPDTPTSFRATNIGASPTSVTLAWNAAARAASYKLYYRTATTGALNHFLTTSALTHPVSMGADTPHEFWIEAVDAAGRVSKTMAGPVRVRSGHNEQSIAAGSANTGLQSFNSWKNWRAGRWGYSTDLLFGWYNTEANRYHLFFELNSDHIRNVIASRTPQLNGRWSHITANGAEIHIDRTGVHGNHGTAYNVEVQLATVSYSNNAEPGNQPGGNVASFRMPANAEGRVAVAVYPSWLTAIFQRHAAYNGFMWRAYTRTGGRQPYIGVEHNALWAMNYTWPKIVTVAQANTSAW